jgi:response regulator RpfG family c-di-GMP phosphodiesterase
MVVDDEESIRLAIGKFLRSRDYEAVTVDSGSAAIDLLTGQRFTLMLCDIRMPGMSGIEVVAKASAIDVDMAILMLTAVNDAPTATEALSNGAMGYLMKPIELEDLHGAIVSALRKRDTAIKRRAVERRIREEVALRTEELERERATLRDLTVSIAETLINALESKDVYLRGFSQRVADVAAAIADQLGLDAEMVESVRIAGRLHDIGRIGIRESILNKPGPLTAEEFDHVKDHVRIGLEILAPLQHLGHVLAFVQDHHERWDGNGYPRGLSGDQSSIGGRILAAADAYAALTSRRAYREPVSGAEAIARLRGTVGSQLDARIYDALKSVIERNQSLLVFIDDPHVR